MTMPAYPLEEVRDIKVQRLDKARRLVKQRIEELAKEEAKLEEVRAARDKVKQHKQDKLDQLREAFDEGTTSDEVIAMKNYLKVVDERVVTEQEKVNAQKQEVEKAKENLAIAREEVRRKQTEVDKLDLHKEQWTKVTKDELQREQDKELDEIGNVLYLKNREKWS